MESTTRQILIKIKIATQTLERALTICKDSSAIRQLSDKLKSCEENFMLSVGPTLAKNKESHRLSSNTTFQRLMSVEDYIKKIDMIMANCEANLYINGIEIHKETSMIVKMKRSVDNLTRHRTKQTRALCSEFQKLFDMYPTNCTIDVQKIDYEKCPTCLNEMVVDASRSELYCNSCGTIRELVGTVFEDSQFYSQEGQKAKSGTFNPNRHFQFWWAHILARESDEELGDKETPGNQYGEVMLNQLRAIIKRDGKFLQLLTVNDIRLMIREIGRSDLNKNVSLILKKLTGIGPPQIPDSISIKAENLFTKAIEIGEKNVKSDRINRNYYPYYIYKILDAIIPIDDYENRRVLFYIYIQSKETVESNDVNWEFICQELSDELTYVPTDRSQSLQYR